MRASTVSVTTQSKTVWSSVRYMCLVHSHLNTKGTSLTQEQAEEELRRICPKAELNILYYGVGECTL